MAATNAEIDVLTPGGYGALSISKGISIQGHGFAGISVSNNGTGIGITAPSTDSVSLNGLLIDGGGGGGTGILFNSGKSLTVENCVVRNMTGNGLILLSEAEATQTVAVSNSYFSDTTGNGIEIETFGSAGTVTASIDRTVFSGNGTGLEVQASLVTSSVPVSVAVTDSIAANNGTGFSVLSNTSIANLSLTHALIEGNGSGIHASGTNATAWVAQSTFTGNTLAFSIDTNGVVNSYGDNYVTSGGGSSGTTPVSKQSARR